jgi:hypothetical protein
MGIEVDDPVRAAAARANTVAVIAASIRRCSQQQKTHRVRRRVAAGMALAAAVFGLVVVWPAIVSMLQAQSPSAAVPAPASGTAAQLDLVHGEVHAVVAGERRVATPGQPVWLRDGDQVSTEAGSQAGVELAGRARVKLSSATSMRILHTELSAQRLALGSGRVNVAVPEDGAKQRLAVKTPDAEIHVVGTMFSIEYGGQAGVQGPVTVVMVSRGRVRVIPQVGDSLVLLAGQRWVSRSPQAEQAEALESAVASPEPAKVAAQRRSVRRAAPKDSSPISWSNLSKQNRLYRTALAARNNGDDAGAVGLLNQFLARYPKSPLVQEARVERFRALKRMGKHDAAARHARRYLAEHGDGFAREEARSVVLSPPKPQK